MKTRFVLIQTSHAGNVGAAARALKVMGFDDLVLVEPRWPNVLRRDETIQRASGATDVLNSARIVGTLDEALEGIDHVCATAMTPRDFGPPTRAPRVHFQTLLNGPVDREAIDDLGLPLPLEGIAFLFGSERFGMRNEDVYKSHVCLRIPTNPTFGSLNLAAAVQLVAYDWRMALDAEGTWSLDMPAPQGERAADAESVQSMLTHLASALVAVDFLNPTAPKKLMPRLNHFFNRARPTVEEIHILRGIAKAMLRVTSKPTSDQRPGPLD